MGTTGVRTILYPVRDLAKAKELFTRLAGREPMADSPYCVGYDLEGQQIGLVPNGHDSQNMTGTTAPRCREHGPMGSASVAAASSGSNARVTSSTTAASASKSSSAAAPQASWALSIRWTWRWRSRSRSSTSSVMSSETRTIPQTFPALAWAWAQTRVGKARPSLASTSPKSNLWDPRYLGSAVVPPRTRGQRQGHVSSPANRTPTAGAHPARTMRRQPSVLEWDGPRRHGTATTRLLAEQTHHPPDVPDHACGALDRLQRTGRVLGGARGHRHPTGTGLDRDRPHPVAHDVVQIPGDSQPLGATGSTGAAERRSPCPSASQVRP